MRPDFPLPDVGWPPTQGLWDGAAAGELRLPRCAGCGRFHVVSHAFLPQFRGALPLVPALVSIVEDPDVRLVTRIVEAAPADLRVDQPVHVVFRPISFDGVDGSVVAPLFAPD